MASVEQESPFWREVEEAFSAVLASGDEGRASALDLACAGRPEVRLQVEALLAAHARADGFITPITTPDLVEALAGEEPPDPHLGQTLSHYQIQSLISRGGMGIVYRALDLNLGREVALKLLPPSLVANPERRRRFVQEARTAATLEHPHVAAVYEIAEAGEITFIAMELIRGETLGAQLWRERMKPVRALELAIEVAEGLACAHERGIVHRDLKPGNIMMTGEGHAKIIDFGLAKLTEPSAAAADAAALDPEAGRVMGTAAYMSPEQARGRTIDHRSDIFSFGIVVHEMLTGARPFQSDSYVDALDAFLDSPAPRLPSFIPSAANLQRILDRCLAKDPLDRYQGMKDVIADLRAAHRRLELGSHRTTWALAALVAVAAVAAIAVVGVREWQSAPARPLPARFEIAPPANMRIATSELSADGRQLALIALDDHDQSGLWVRAVDSGTARLLPGTENAHSPFWSPDGRSLGFFDADRLKTVAVSGGAPKVLAEVTGDARGGSWAPDEVIVFAPTFQGGLMKVPARGGPVSPLTTLDAGRREESHRWPWFLPDGRRFLYQSMGADEPTLYVGSLDGMAPVRVMAASSGSMFAAPGWLLFRQDRTLLAQPFDPDQLRVVGEQTAVIENLVFDSFVKGGRGFTASQTGLMAARSGAAPDTELSWLDRAGNQVGAPLGRANYYKPRLSPDGRHLAVALLGDDADIWLFDLARGGSARVTVTAGYDSDPAWSRDSSTLFFSSKRKTSTGIFQRALSGAGNDTMILSAAGFAIPCDGSPDGKFLMIELFDPKTNIDLWVKPLAGDGKAVPFVQTPAVEYSATFSPDGRWVAYVSNESGRFEVYVRPFQWGDGAPASGVTAGKRMVSTAGGTMPKWRHDGRELYYYSADGKMMAAAVGPTSAFDLGVPVSLFAVKLKPPPERHYDVAPDGRFLVNQVDAAELATPLTIALNWDAAIRR